MVKIKKNMIQERLQDLYNKVSDVIDSHYSYHVWYSCGQPEWNSDFTRISFEVFGISDQGEGSEWTENWGIDSDGKIYSSEEDKPWNNFEEFKANW